MVRKYSREKEKNQKRKRSKIAGDNDVIHSIFAFRRLPKPLPVIEDPPELEDPPLLEDPIIIYQFCEKNWVFK